MLKLLFTTALVGLIATPAFAQSTKDKLLALEEALNDPSPIIRLAAVEEALADKSAAVRKYAQSQALASDDDDIKAMALTNFFQTRKQLTIMVAKSQKLLEKEASLEDAEALAAFQKAESYSYGVQTAYSPSIIYLIKSFNPVSGEIKGYCMKGYTSANESSTFSGSVVGDKISLQQDCYAVRSAYEECSLQLEFSDQAKYVGTMRCTSENYPAYIEIPLK